MHMTNKAGHYIAVLGLIVFGLYAFLLLPSESGAVSSMTVGTLSMSFVPQGALPELESLTFEYTGAGFMDLTGYTVIVSDVAVYTLGTTVLQSGEKITFCATTNTATECTPAWDGAVFPDEGGTVRVQGADGGDVLLVPYGAVGDSAVVREIYERMESVYAERDKVDLCHTRDGVTFKMAKDQVTKLVNGNGHAGDAQDIIPPFFYRLDADTQYNPGMNWDTGAAVFERGCM